MAWLVGEWEKGMHLVRTRKSRRNTVDQGQIKNRTERRKEWNGINSLMNRIHSMDCIALEDARSAIDR